MTLICLLEIHMEYVKLFFTNRILISGLLGWAVAQVLKAIIYIIINKELRIERLFGDGGMPSGHSATVTAVALSTGLSCGFDSAIFAIAFIMAIIVMHDAMGVRLETGKQAKVINDMLETFQKLGRTDVPAEQQLKEFVGHTPVQVAAGAVLGIVVALVFHFI